MVSFRFSLMCVFMLSVMTVSGQNVGWATQYGGNSNGNACGYAEVPQSSFPFGLYMACGGSIFDEGYGCGKCYRVTCTGPKDTTRNDCFCDADTPSVIAQCMDQCPECDGSQGTHFDLEEFLTMDTIVADGTGGLCGEIAIAYERVDCAYAGNVKIRSKSGTTGYWYGLHVDDVAGAGAVSSVAIKTNGAASTWLSCVKTAGNPSFFLCDLDGHTPISAPLDVRLINDYGQAIECTDCITNLDASQEFDFGSNFPAISGTPVTTSSSGTTSTATASSQGYIGIQNGVETTEWYLSLYLLNADGFINKKRERIVQTHIKSKKRKYKWKTYRTKEKGKLNENNRVSVPTGSSFFANKMASSRVPYRPAPIELGNEANKELYSWFKQLHIRLLEHMSPKCKSFAEWIRPSVEEIRCSPLLLQKHNITRELYSVRKKKWCREKIVDTYFEYATGPEWIDVVVKKVLALNLSKKNKLMRKAAAEV